MNEYIGDSGKELEGAAEQIVESYMGEYMQVVHFFQCCFSNYYNDCYMGEYMQVLDFFSTFAFQTIILIVLDIQEYMKGWYQDYCAKTGQFCDQVHLKVIL